jgi:hypothetical protein
MTGPQPADYWAAIPRGVATLQSLTVTATVSGDLPADDQAHVHLY